MLNIHPPDGVADLKFYATSPDLRGSSRELERLKTAQQADSRGAESDKGVRFRETTVLSTGPTGVRDSTRTTWMGMGTTPLLATGLPFSSLQGRHGGGEVLSRLESWTVEGRGLPRGARAHQRGGLHRGTPHHPEVTARDYTVGGSTSWSQATEPAAPCGGRVQRAL